MVRQPFCSPGRPTVPAARAFSGRGECRYGRSHSTVIDEHRLLDRYFHTRTNGVESLIFPLFMDKSMVKRGLAAETEAWLESKGWGHGLVVAPAFASPRLVAMAAGRTKPVLSPTASA